MHLCVSAIKFLALTVSSTAVLGEVQTLSLLKVDKPLDTILDKRSSLLTDADTAPAMRDDSGTHDTPCDIKVSHICEMDPTKLLSNWFWKELVISKVSLDSLGKQN
jgi:hypothetical protein